MKDTKKNITRAEIKETIKFYNDWYQSIRFGFMLETKGEIRYGLLGQVLSECRKAVRKALGKKTKDEALIESLPELAGKRVIDIGCNSGLYSVAASCRGADFVLGVDQQKLRIDQARDVASIFKKLGRPVGRIEFRQVNDISEHLELFDDMDVLMACCVLYHLGPLHRFKERLTRSRINTLILQGNTNRRSRIGKKDKNNPSSKFYEPENKTWGEVLCEIDGMCKLCQSIGFKVEKVAFATHTHPVVIAQRA